MGLFYWRLAYQIGEEKMVMTAADGAQVKHTVGPWDG
jgi:hypothetical protein